MPELLDEIRSEINRASRNCGHSSKEAESLQRALDALGKPSTRPHPNGRRSRRTRSSRGRATARSPRERVTMRAAVIDYLRENPGSTAGDVAKALNLNRNSLGTRLAQLAKSGELVKAQRGYSVA